MSNSTHDTSEMDAAATKIAAQAVAKVASAIAVTLEIGMLKQSWGSDATGDAFGGAYVEEAGNTLQEVQRGPYHIGQIAELLGFSAKNYADIEATNVDAGRSVQV